MHLTTFLLKYCNVGGRSWANNPFEEDLIQYYDADEDEWIDVATVDGDKMVLMELITS